MAAQQTAVVEPPVSTDQGGGAVVATVVKPAPPQRKPRQLPPYRVLLHNDDVNTVEHVILSILKLTPLDMEEAVTKTLEADQTGVALLLVTHKERAELYHEQFQSLSLTVSIEPAEG